MELCQDKRGDVHRHEIYRHRPRVELHYILPLNEIIYDFFDALKSRSKGYASLDYELLGLCAVEARQARYSCSTVNMVDALSFIVHEDKAYARAQKNCGKTEGQHPAPAL